MNNLLYGVAIVLIIMWLFGTFIYSAGLFIHLLLIFAVVAIIFRLIRGKRV